MYQIRYFLDAHNPDTFLNMSIEVNRSGISHHWTQFLNKNVTNIGICYGMDHLFSYQLILDITYNYPLNGQQDWTS